MEDIHLVPASGRLFHNRSTDKSGATNDQYAHGASLAALNHPLRPLRLYQGFVDTSGVPRKEEIPMTLLKAGIPLTLLLDLLESDLEETELDC